MEEVKFDENIRALNISLIAIVIAISRCAIFGFDYNPITLQTNNLIT